MARRYTTYARVVEDLPKDLPTVIQSNALLGAGINPTTTSLLVNSIGAFASSGRAYVESELVAWDGVSTVGSGPTGSLINVSRGLKGTAAASHATASSIYNSWIHERIEEVSETLDAALPAYDPFPDATDATDPTPAPIESIARDLTVFEGYVKVGIDRSANTIHKARLEEATKRLAGFQAGTYVLEPRVFVDTLVFGVNSGLSADEAILAKRNLDPWTCSIANAPPTKYIPGSVDEMPMTNRVARAARIDGTGYSTVVGGIIYFSELRQRWIFRRYAGQTDNTNIAYLHSEARNGWQHSRRAFERGYVDVRRG